MSAPDFRALCVRLADDLTRYHHAAIETNGYGCHITAALLRVSDEALRHQPPATGEVELPTDYIDPEHVGEDRHLLEVFYCACHSEGGTVDEITLRGLRAVLARWGAAPPQPPAVGEVAELVEWLRNHELDELSNYDWEALRTRVAELLQHLADGPAVPAGREPASVVEQPTSDEPQPIPSNWQPIATAPRDGTEILITDYDVIDIVSWDRGYWLNRENEDRYPVHWQPLPEHPQLLP